MLRNNQSANYGFAVLVRRSLLRANVNGKGIGARSLSNSLSAQRETSCSE